ncbi:O-antigen ligase family protein [Cerasicoccus maritimus]|uniref:O-antigen ligase family protein n=1 Tax=Cerasicoccus maritimus TaxID=490089 RepID=UPI0028524BB4|nr:O-antigen ligase family protein [Cerasicoccus maritimus]
MRKFAKYFYLAVMVINYTFMFTFAAAAGGVSFRLIGVLSLLGLALYCYVNRSSALMFLLSGKVKVFMFLYTALPIFLVVVSPVFPLSFLGYQVLSFLLVVATAVFVREEGVRELGKWILLCWFISVVGILISYFFPGVFKAVAQMQEEAKQVATQFRETKISSTASGRAFGFFMQPNRAAFGIVVTVVLLALTYFRDKVVMRYAFLTMSFATILLTGSRGGMLQIVVFFGLLFLNEIVSGVIFQGRKQSFASVVPIIAVFGAIMILCGVGVYYLTSDGSVNGSMLDRALNVVMGRETLATDGSVQARLYAQEVYLGQILDSPLWGHGLAASVIYNQAGLLPLSSHNSFIEYAFDHGIPATVALFIVFVVMALDRNAKKLRGLVHYNFSLIFVCVVFVATLVLGGVFYARFFSVALGMWLSLQYAPSPRMLADFGMQMPRQHY